MLLPFDHIMSREQKRIPEKACKHPCYDCPFRKDIIPYQSAEDVEHNIRLSLNPAGLAACHQTMDKPDVPYLACAGFLTFLKNIKAPWWHERLTRFNFTPGHHVLVVFNSIAEFIERGKAPIQSLRRAAWFFDQPLSKQIRLLQEEKESKHERSNAS